MFSYIGEIVFNYDNVIKIKYLLKSKAKKRDETCRTMYYLIAHLP
jgi:hypothetical protein